jgi:hypothetical protein
MKTTSHFTCQTRTLRPRLLSKPVRLGKYDGNVVLSYPERYSLHFQLSLCSNSIQVKYLAGGSGRDGLRVWA